MSDEIKNTEKEKSESSKDNNKGNFNYILLLIAIFTFGATGIHRFLTGYKLIGAIQLICLLIVASTHFELIGFILGLWVVFDLISVLTGTYKDASGNKITGSPNFKHSLLIRNSIFVLFVLAIVAIVYSVSDIENTVAKKPYASVNIQNKNVITKANFQGKWAFNSEVATLYCEKLSDELTGAKVVINGKSYAITRNLENKYEFLPYELWADAQTEIVECGNVSSDGKCKICKGVSLDNRCKVPLSDMVNFADTLCN